MIILENGHAIPEPNQRSALAGRLHETLQQRCWGTRNEVANIVQGRLRTFVLPPMHEILDFVDIVPMPSQNAFWIFCSAPSTSDPKTYLEIQTTFTPPMDEA